MSKLRVNSFTLSLDGYGAGPAQDEQNPMGLRSKDLHKWFLPTQTFQSMHGGGQAGTTGVDDDFAKRGFENGFIRLLRGSAGQRTGLDVASGREIHRALRADSWDREALPRGSRRAARGEGQREHLGRA